MIELIVAVDNQGAIGSANSLGFECKDDMTWFRWYTKGKRVCMGRSTFESIGSKPLPGRENIVLTREPKSKPSIDGVLWMTLGEVLERYSDVCFMGGSDVYEQVLQHIDRAAVTFLNMEIQNPDAFFSIEALENVLPNREMVREIEGGKVFLYSSLID